MDLGEEMVMTFRQRLPVPKNDHAALSEGRLTREART